MFYFAKTLQVLGLFLVLDGLYIGIRYDDMRTELYLLLGGAVLFFIGHKIAPGRSS